MFVNRVHVQDTLCLVLCILSQPSHQTDQAEYINVALGKPAQQSSTHNGHFADKAVDGNTNPHFGGLSCSHTNKPVNNFFLVDLQKQYPIRYFSITQRKQVSSRFQNFFIYVSDVDPNPIQEGRLTGELCLSHPGQLPAAGPHSLKCSSHAICGRYVYVWKPDHGSLSVCEFEVLVAKSELDWDPIGLLMFRGMKSSSESPVFTPKLERCTLLDCVSVCLAVHTGCHHTFGVQVETETKTCECVQESVVDGANSNSGVSGAGWTLMTSYSNE